MALPKEGKLLRIFIGESDKHEGKPLYEWIIHQARKRSLTGVTICRGIEGYGRAGRIHTAKVLRLSEDLPIIIEIVDIEEKINNFVELIDPVIDGGLVTVENVQVRLYRSKKKSRGIHFPSIFQARFWETPRKTKIRRET